MPRGRPKKDLTDIKDRLVAFILETSSAVTSAKDEELAEKLGVTTRELSQALKEAVAEKRVLRSLSTKKTPTGFARFRTLHVHRPRAVKRHKPPPGYGTPVYTCPLCGDPLPR
jgi:hypothetical protein